MAVDRLHIVGDVFDRGPRADRILDLLMRHHCVDVQWGNHDILWMGAAAGNEACIACVLNLALQYNTLDIVENGYGISLRDMIAFAQETYRDCTWFMPRTSDDKAYLKTSMDTLSKVHKAIAIMQFKLEGQLILRHPEYEMENRLLLDKIDATRKTVKIDGVDYPLNDADFPTVDLENPYELTLAEREPLSDTLSGIVPDCSSRLRFCTIREACTAFTTKTCCITAASRWMRTGGSRLSLPKGRSFEAEPIWMPVTIWPAAPIFCQKDIRINSGAWISYGIFGAGGVLRCLVEKKSPLLNDTLYRIARFGRRKRIHITVCSETGRCATGSSPNLDWIQQSPISSTVTCR